MTRGVVENAAARYQAQGRVAGCAVNGFRREPEFGVPTYAGDAENSRDPVGERHIDAVPGAEGAQAEEDSRTLSAAFSARTPAGRTVYDLHGQGLSPRPGTAVPAAVHVSWHIREVFKGDPLPA